MNEKTKEIYQFLLSETDYLKEAGKSIEKVVEDFLQTTSLSLREKEYEEVRERTLSTVVSKALHICTNVERDTLTRLFSMLLM